MSKKRRRDKQKAAKPGGAAPRGDAGESRGRDAQPTVPGWLPVALYLGLTVFLFRSFIFSDAMLFGGDTLGLGYAVRAWYAEAMAELGRFPRWQPMILGGTPFLEALSAGDSFYPPSLLLLLIMEPYRALGWKLVVHVAAAGFFMFGWTRAIGGSRAAALVAGTGYMLAPVFISLVQPGHDGKLFVTALAPLLFWTVERHFVRPRLATFSQIALVVALVIYTTHFQMAYFLFGGVGLFAIFRAVQHGRRRAEQASVDSANDAGGPRGLAPAGIRFGLFLAAALTGAGIAGAQFFPAADYVTEASRRVQTTRSEAGEVGVDWSSSWSIHQEEAFSLIVPEFAGNNSRGWTSENPYWGRNAFKDNHEYAGLILLLLAAVSFAGGARSGLRYFFLGLGALALLFGLGAHTPVWRIFYEVVPGIRLFRAPSQALFLFAFSAATLAALGVDRLLRDDTTTETGKHPLYVLAGGAGLLLLIALAAASGVLSSLWTGIVWADIDPSRQQVFESMLPTITRGAWTAFLLAGLLGGLAWAYRSGFLAPLGLLAGLVVLVTVDEARIASRFITPMDFEEWSAPDANIQALLEREAGSDEPYRLLSMRGRGQDIDPMMHGIELAAGHHPNDLSRYRELIGMVGSSEPWNLYENANIRRMLNVRYILYPDYALGQEYTGPGIVQRLQLQDGRAYETMIAEPGLARARLVGSAVVKADDESVDYMLSDTFDPQREVVLAEPPPTPLADAPVEGVVEWLERGPDEVRLSVTADAPALLVVADNWYPDWHATVGGEPAPVLRAYHTLRAVPVPAGQSEVRMWYASDIVRTSAWISLVLFLGLIGANGLVWWRSRAPTEEDS